MIIVTREDLARTMRNADRSHYVYLLRHPDEAAVHGGIGTPFYVGIGQKSRIFEHEEEARNSSSFSPKLTIIRAIWASGREVARTIDSFHEREPWTREEELMSEIGFCSDGSGSLINAQRYSPSSIADGVELRKYASDPSVADGDSIPAGFKLLNVALCVSPKRPAGTKSVFAKIYKVVGDNPGITGFELIQLLKTIDFSGNKSPYTQSGVVSAAWLAGWIDGAVFHSRAGYLQQMQARQKIAIVPL